MFVNRHIHRLSNTAGNADVIPRLIDLQSVAVFFVRMRFGDGWFRGCITVRYGTAPRRMRELRLHAAFIISVGQGEKVRCTWRKSKREYLQVRKLATKKRKGEQIIEGETGKRKDERTENGRSRKRERQEVRLRKISFTVERQRESFSLKAPFCPGAVFRFESNLPCRAPCYVYLPTRIQRTGKKKAPDSLRFPAEVNSGCEA